MTNSARPLHRGISSRDDHRDAEQIVERRTRRQESGRAAVTDALENVGTVGTGGKRGGGFNDEIVFVGTERAFVEPKDIAAFVVKGNGLQPIAGKRLLQRFADRGLRIAASCDTRVACMRENSPNLSSRVANQRRPA